MNMYERHAVNQPVVSIDIQPAMHPVAEHMFDDPMSRIQREILNGNASIHAWSGPAVERIKEGSRPVLMVPDGLASMVEQTNSTGLRGAAPYEIGIKPPSPHRVAALIPAWPGELRQAEPDEPNFVLAIGADSIPPADDYPFLGGMQLYGQLMEDEDSLLRDLTGAKLKAAVEVFATLAAAGIISTTAITAAGTAKARSGQRAKSEGAAESSTVLNAGTKRRTLLKAGGVIIGVSAAGSALVSNADVLAEQAPNNQIKDLLLQIARTVDVDGMLAARNAMLILKSRDAAARAAELFPEVASLPEMRTSIIVGNGHVSGIQDLVDNESACMDAVRGYVITLLPALEEAVVSNLVENGMSPSEARKWAVDKLVDYMAATSISKITNPQTDPATGGLYPDWLERAVQPVEVLRSQKVLSALAGIHL